MKADEIVRFLSYDKFIILGDGKPMQIQARIAGSDLECQPNRREIIEKLLKGGVIEECRVYNGYHFESFYFRGKNFNKSFAKIVDNN